jgi:4-cresol dehydrogenase (hydroxylating)
MLPPGVSANDFNAALAAFRQAVGKEWVFTSDEDVALYRDAYSPNWGEPDERLAAAAIAPASTEEVQAVMRAAHRYRIPIYPVSTGKNLGYGGSAPNMRGSVVLDLKRMNRVLQVDDRRHFAIVEPGVSYFDLYQYIQDHQLKVWIDVPGPGWGSPIGNSLDHGLGDTWGIYRNHFSAHCGMEVVLADGTLIRTGMGALPGADTWAEYPYGYGPTLDGLFAQGNFGVVTKMGFWLMPAPESYLSGSIHVPRRAQIADLIDLVGLLENQGIGGEPQYSSALHEEQQRPEFQALSANGRFPSDAELDAFAAHCGKPYWTVKLQFYGPSEVVAAQWQAARRIARARIPDATFADGDAFRLPLSKEDQQKVDLVAFGIPSLAQFALTARSPWNPAGSDGHLFFTPIIPKTGEAILKYQQVMWDELGKLGLPRQVGPFTPPNTWFYRAHACILVFLISRSDVEGNRKLREAFKHLIQVAAAHGWGEYRTPPMFQDAVRATYNFNDHALLRVTESLKDAIDPNGILAAGRYGIWPRAMRGKK